MGVPMRSQLAKGSVPGAGWSISSKVTAVSVPGPQSPTSTSPSLM